MLPRLSTPGPPPFQTTTTTTSPSHYLSRLLLCCVALLTTTTGIDCSTAATDHITLDTEPKFNLTQLSVPKDEFIAQIQSFDHSLFVVVTAREMKIYKLTRGRELVFKGSFLHQIQNAFDEHVHSYCTHGYIAFLKKYTMYFFRLSEEKDSLQYNLSYPNSYFGVKWFSNVIGVSPWNNTVYMQTGDREVTMFDFRDVYHATSKRIPITDGLQGIRILSVIDKGQALAIFYTNSLEIVNIAQGQNFKTIKLYRLTDTVVTAEYNQYSNKLVYIFSNGRAGSMKVDRDQGYDRNNFNTRIQTDEERDSTQVQILRTGMGITSLIYPDIVEFRDLMDSNSSTIDEVKLPDDLANNKYHYSTSIRLSNMLVVKNNETESIKIKFLWMKSKNSKTCHPSCTFGCDEPFRPCSRFPIIMMSLGLAMLVLFIFIQLFKFVVRYFEAQLSANLSSKDAGIQKLFAKNMSVVAKAKDRVVVTIDTRNATPSIMHILSEEFQAALPESSFLEASAMIETKESGRQARSKQHEGSRL